MKHPLVSFVIPVYNGEKYLTSCLESIIGQSFFDFEIILINDGSIDGTKRICDEYSRKYDYIRSYYQNNQGVSVARNKGIELAVGEWICFIDSDDCISSELLKCCCCYLNNTYDICFFGYKDVRDRDFRNLNLKLADLKGTFLLELKDFSEFCSVLFNRDRRGKFDYYRMHISLSMKLYRKDFLAKNDITFCNGIALGEDTLFNLQAYSCASKGVYIDAELYYHRLWSSSATTKCHMDIERKYHMLHMELEKWIEKQKKPEMYQVLLLEKKMWSLGFCCLQKYCNSGNPEPYYKRRQEFYETVNNEYSEVVCAVPLKDFRIKKRLLFFFIKYRMFLFIELLCRIYAL